MAILKQKILKTYINSNITGNINSKSATLAGLMKGNVNSEKIKLKGTADMEGVLNQKNIND